MKSRVTHDTTLKKGAWILQVPFDDLYDMMRHGSRPESEPRERIAKHLSERAPILAVHVTYSCSVEVLSVEFAQDLQRTDVYRGFRMILKITYYAVRHVIT